MSVVEVHGTIDNALKEQVAKVSRYLARKYNRSIFDEDIVMRETLMNADELRAHRLQGHLVRRTSNALASFIVLYCQKEQIMNFIDRFNAWMYSKILIMMQWKQDELVTKQELYYEPCGFKRGVR